jgi:hypothetical protein
LKPQESPVLARSIRTADDDQKQRKREHCDSGPGGHAFSSFRWPIKPANERSAAARSDRHGGLGTGPLVVADEANRAHDLHSSDRQSPMAMRRHLGAGVTV